MKPDDVQDNSAPKLLKTPMIHHMHHVLRGIWRWLQLLNRYLGSVWRIQLARNCVFYFILSCSLRGLCSRQLWYVADEQSAVLEQGKGGRGREGGGPDSQLRSGDEMKETAGGGEHVQGWMDAEMEGILHCHANFRPHMSVNLTKPVHGVSPLP